MILETVRRERARARLRHPSANDPATSGYRSANYLALLFITVALTLMGLVMVLSASTITGLEDKGSIWFYFQKQAMWTAIGAVAMAAMIRLDYRRLAAIAPLIAGATGVLLILVLVPGVGISANGSTRWLGVGSITIQPAELAKLAVAIFSASLLARRADYMGDPQMTERPVLVVAVLSALLVLLQPSQGTAMIIVSVALIMLFLAGAPLRRIVVMVLIGALAAYLLAASASYRWARVQAVLDPWEQPTTNGYQLIQSLVGIASGGVSGVGLGAGRSKWGFLPFAHTDFIFAVVAEELGLIGAAIVIALFVVLTIFGVRTAAQAPDRFGALLAGGICSWISIQAFINISAVVGLVPISGITLPFMSVGGSSLVVTMAAMGIVLSIARQTVPRERRRSVDPAEHDDYRTDTEQDDPSTLRSRRPAKIFR